MLFGIFKRPGFLKTELVEVNKNGVPRVRKDYGLSVSWAGNLTTSLAVFVLHNVQPADGKKTFGIQVDFGYEHDMLTDIVRLQVEEKRKWYSVQAGLIMIVVRPLVLRVFEKRDI